MAIQLSANYSKKLGLPQYSSHSFSASIQVELTDITQAEAEIQKLYQLLQMSVDHEIQNSGFVPEAHGSNGHNQQQNVRNYQPHSNSQRRPQPGNNGQRPQARPTGDTWNCTPGQKGFIQRIVHENNMQIQDAEGLSQQLYGIGVKDLDKMQASQLIEELLTKAGKPPRQHQWQQRQNRTQQQAA
ncbi:hypothetical protein [Brevifollis gellanilyticus]|uniref:Uncharacterized protein n=1 Tax=Brevifollis gellanilyticus TaxID=748831 RepID=A0A512M9U7_9BACT|nr:hypothetical protein [Brevifollis gellanilyticus]GEP43101.1 hypothetical protein BGE01nite_23920 [Brevifollis gellanilyticus]